ncbi:hypothetical protein CDIK_0963 [Cucumispora dikerogammari]|nr:hypothetical protein CDIK_0963 [Cucumispora dikerogammari]
MKTKTKPQVVVSSGKISKEIKALMLDIHSSFKKIENILFVFKQKGQKIFTDIYLNKKIYRCLVIDYKLIIDFNNKSGISFTKPLICSNTDVFTGNEDGFKTDSLKRVINFFIDKQVHDKSDSETNGVDCGDILRIRGFSILIEDGVCSRVKLRSLGPSLDLNILKIEDLKE